MRKGSFRYIGRAAMAAAAAIVLTSVELPAAWAEAARPVAKSATAGAATSTDFSAARRRHRSTAAPATTTGTFVGTMGAMPSGQQRRAPLESYAAPRQYQFFPTGP